MLDLEGDSVAVVILTALDVEYEAVRERLSGLRAHEHKGTQFEVGRLPGDAGTVAIALTGPGNSGAAVLAERAINEFQPAALLFVGIAGAVHDGIALGDVVVAVKVYAYHGGRDDGELHARPVSWQATHALDQAARQVALNLPDPLTTTSEDGQARAPKIHFRPIAAGEVVLNSRKSAVARHLHHHYNDAAAIETEGAGVAEAGHLNNSLPTLVIRGIGDYADGSKAATDRDGWRTTAARNAAAFAIAFATEIAPCPAEPRQRWSARRGTRRWLFRAGVVVAAAVASMFLTVHASYAGFYGALGMDLPVGIGTVLLSTAQTTVLFIVVAVASLGAAVAGMAMSPSEVGQSRAAITATAMAIVVGLVGTLAVALIPHPVSEAVALLFLVGMLGALVWMVRWPTWHGFAGLSLGLAAAVAVFGLGRWVGDLTGSLWWLIAALVGGGAAVTFGLWKWQAYEFRRSGLGQAANTSPADLLSQMNPLKMMMAVVKQSMGTGDARRTVVAVGLSTVLVVGASVWLFIYLVGSASVAGAAAREYGYVPADRVALAMSMPAVRPASVTLKRPDNDPVGVCGASRWAASLIVQNRDGSWVLLRPRQPGVASPEIVWLSAADYAVRPVLQPAVEPGQPWLRPAC